MKFGLRRTFGLWAATAGLGMLLAGCGSDHNSFLQLSSPSSSQPPAVQFAQPLAYGALSGNAVGLAAGNFDTNAGLDLATTVDTNPSSPSSGTVLYIQQAGVDALAPYMVDRLDVTDGTSFKKLKTLMTSSAGNLIAATDDSAGSVGLIRFAPPIPAGDTTTFPPGVISIQTAGPYPTSIAPDAKMAQGTIDGVDVFAVPGTFDGPKTGVSLNRVDTLDPTASVANFVATDGDGITAPTGVCIADFNGDGRNDLAVVGNNKVVVYLQDAAHPGQFLAGQAVTGLVGHANDIACGQFNSDAGNKADLAVATDQGIEVFFDGDFTDHPGFGIPMANVEEIHAGDVTGSSATDLYGIFGPTAHEAVFVAPGVGDGSFTNPVPAEVGGDSTHTLRDVVAGQFVDNTPSDNTDPNAIDFAVLLRSASSSRIVVVPQLP